MESYPYVSIVVCIYNGAKTLESALDSLLEQDYPKDKYEIVLIDDGSIDGSADICKDLLKKSGGEYPHLTYIFQKNSGLGGARNTGVFISKGLIVAFIDQDAVAHKGWVNEIAKAFDGDDKIGVVGGKIEILNKESWFATFIHWIHYYMEDKNGDEIIPIIGTNMAFRKQVFEKVGGFFDHFISRGDEHSFIDIKALPYFKRNVTRAAIVYHERPWSFRAWFKERFYNGHEYALVHHISRRYEKSNMRHNGYVAFRVLCFAFPFLLFVGICFNMPVITVSGLASLTCFIYRSFWRDNIFIKAKVLKREYGVLSSISLFPLTLGVVGIGKMKDDYGFLRGLWKYRNTQISDTISGDKIQTVLATD